MEALLARAIRQVSAARTRQELAQAFCRSAPEALSVDVVGFYLYGKPGRDALALVSGAPALFTELYEQHGRAVDPVLTAVVDAHTAVASNELMSASAWRSHLLYRQVSGRFGLEHIMTAPVLAGGRLAGTLNVARTGWQGDFGRAEVASLGALAAHASAALGSLPPGASTLPLTNRELEIAGLVALGLTNVSVGRRLGITHNTVKQALKKIYARTGVGTRTELAVLLRTGSALVPVLNEGPATEGPAAAERPDGARHRQGGGDAPNRAEGVSPSAAPAPTA